MLDRSRDYGTTTGLYGAMYEQDGKLFDKDGNEVEVVDRVHRKVVETPLQPHLRRKE